MGTSLSFGYTKPEKNEDGDTWGQYIEEFMEGIANHTHNGIDSAVLNAVVEKATYATSTWTPSGEEFTATIQFPAGQFMSDKVFRRFYLADGTVSGDWVINATKFMEFRPTITWSESSVGSGYDQATVTCNTNAYNLVVEVA